MRTLLVALLVCGIPCLALATPVITNNSFESPSTGWEYLAGAVNGWTYGGNSGVASVGSPWFIGNPPDGNQAAFCQVYLGSSCTISQDVSGFTVGDTYSVSVYLADRAGYTANAIDVQLGGVDLGSYTPATTGFTQIMTGTMTATSTTMTLSFAGIAPADNDYDTALDLVTLQENAPGGVPEPASMLLLGCGLAVIAWRKARTFAKR